MNYLNYYSSISYYYGKKETNFHYICLVHFHYYQIHHCHYFHQMNQKLYHFLLILHHLFDFYQANLYPIFELYHFLLYF